MRNVLFTAIFVLVSLSPTVAQDCPKENPNGPSIASARRTLSGIIVYHDALRQWTGLRPDAPVCDQSEIELIPDFSGSDLRNERERKHLETLRGCRATITGTLGLASTGYYSTDIFQSVDQAVPEPSCVSQPASPDMSRARPTSTVRRYYARVTVSNVGEGAIHAEARSPRHLLTPWQAYTHYFLSGGFVLWVNCADGFRMSHVTGSAEAKPEQWDVNQASMDADVGDDKKVKLLGMTFTCTREASPRITRKGSD